eukprot:CAMPEP_0119311580 /NCGR_PEP_ID=MMETSP1333-20130426/23016_1 /TAXON_ID=418940 /ORGANISM="Scyphosphaera apsteinii, Strain RCC1455" /LENGTH=94 /DNA_ID=CAMNT_0007315999 /DNA_START=74 /DNA_END=358 /DNA_ORIENTATION=-
MAQSYQNRGQGQDQSRKAAQDAQIKALKDEVHNLDQKLNADPTKLRPASPRLGNNGSQVLDPIPPPQPLAPSDPYLNPMPPTGAPSGRPQVKAK